MQRLTEKGVHFPLTSPYSPIISTSRQVFPFLFFGAHQKFCYTMSMTTALRGAPSPPTIRTNLFWQQRQVPESGAQTFSPENQDWQPTHQHAGDSANFFSLPSKTPGLHFLFPGSSLCWDAKCTGCTALGSPVSFDESICQWNSRSPSSC